MSTVRLLLFFHCTRKYITIWYSMILNNDNTTHDISVHIIISEASNSWPLRWLSVISSSGIYALVKGPLHWIRVGPVCPVEYGRGASVWLRISHKKHFKAYLCLLFKFSIYLMIFVYLLYSLLSRIEIPDYNYKFAKLFSFLLLFCLCILKLLLDTYACRLLCLFNELTHLSL